MPEGPEVRRAADRIAKAIVGAPTVDVSFAFEHLAALAPALTGERVTAVDTRGKAFLVRFGEVGLNIYAHLQLYGRWYVQRAGERPRTGRQLRVAIETADKAALLYSASDIAVLADDEVDAHPYIAKLGPDCLDSGLTRAALMRRLTRKAFAGRRLGSLYLDQGFVAGIGNYLRSEILFVAGLAPTLRPKDLSTPERRRLAEATIAVSRQAYGTGGVTNDRDRVRRLKREGLKRRQYRHHVFGRDGAECWTCGATIRRGAAAGRRIYWCPGCQRD